MKYLLLVLVSLLPFLSLTQRVTRLDSTYIAYKFHFNKSGVTYGSGTNMNPLDTSLTQDMFDGDYLYILTDNDMNSNLSKILAKTYLNKDSDSKKIKVFTRYFIDEVATDSLRNVLLVNIKSPQCDCEESIYKSITDDVDITKSLTNWKTRDIRVSYIQLYTDSGNYELVGVLIKKFIKSEFYLLVYEK